ncbi:MAG: hypothetical protein U1F30_14565 [Steroidobacteraceae bacterium]
MKPLALALLAATAAASTPPALALGRLADVSIVDRDSGAVLPTHCFHGEYWVAGRPGARYAIAIRNQRGERLLAVTSVDGVNAVSGETAGWSQTGYVFGPWQAYEISGWRKSDQQVAAFEFTAAPDSYAARTGRAASIGVIGIALFRERVPEPVRVPEPIAPPALERAERRRRRRGRRRRGLAAPAAPEEPSGLAKSAAAAPRLGTGHGAREYSYVEHTGFERLHERPDEIVRIRYDSYAHLVAMGVIRERRPLPPPLPDAFPDSPRAGYVPDPPQLAER